MALTVTLARRDEADRPSVSAESGPERPASSVERHPTDGSAHVPPDASAAVAASDAPPTRQDLVRDGVGVQHGRVVFRDGTASIPPMTILAWSSATLPAVDAFTRALREGTTDELAVARSDADGAFALELAGAPATYCMTAIGEGWCAAAHVRALAPSESVVEIPVQPTYVLATRIRAPDGSRPRVDRKLMQGSWSRRAIGTPCTQIAGADRRPELWAFVGGALVQPGPGDLQDSIEFFEIDGPPVALVPLAFSYRVPGHRTLDEVFSASPIAPKLVWSDATVVPTASGWGRVTLRFRDPPPLSDPLPAADRHHGAVIFTPVDGGDELGARLHGSMGDPLVLDGFPAGSYQVVIKLLDGGDELTQTEVSRQHIDVRHADELVIAADFGAFGSLRVGVVDRAGRRYDGPLTLELRRGEWGTTSLSFPRGPYVLRCLRAGACTIVARVRSPGGERTVSGPTSVTIESGVEQHALVPIDEL